MKKRTIILVMSIVALVVFAYFYIMPTSAKIESPSGFGQWGQTILIEYEDGKYEPLNILKQPLSVFHDEKEVVAIRYLLSTYADETTKDASVVIDMTDYEVQFTIGTKIYTLGFPETTLVIPTGEWRDLANKRIFVDTIVGDLATGDYQINIVPKGSITYKINSGPTNQAILPIGAETRFEVQAEVTAQRILTISQTQHGTTSPIPGMHSYDLGTEVQITAIPDDGYHFVNWDGSYGTTNPLTVEMDVNRTVKANFALNEPTYYTLSITTNPTNPIPGAVSKSPDNNQYESGTVVTLTANPGLGWSFSSWSGSISGSTNPTTITMNGNKAVTANFIQNQYTLTTYVDGSGTITKNPNQPSYTAGTTVTLTAIPATNWNFIRWSGPVGGVENPVTLVMDSNKNVGATFTQEDPFVLVHVPNGGESWCKGQSYAITWSTNFIDNVDISLLKGTEEWGVASDVQNDGSHSWIVPMSLEVSGDYRIRVSRSSDTSVYDRSDAYFTIEASAEYEDLTSYIVYSDGNYISVDSTKVSFNAIPRGSVSYVYKNFGSNYFTDYKFDFEFQIDAFNFIDGSGHFDIWAVSDAPHYTYEDRLWLSGYGSKGTSMHVIARNDYFSFVLRDFTSGSTIIQDTICAYPPSSFLGKTFYVTVEKIGLSITATMYSDFARTNSVGTGTITLLNGVQYSLFVPGSSRECQTYFDSTITGWTGNFEME